MPVTLLPDSNFQTVRAQAGAMADDAAPTPANIVAAEVINTLEAPQVAVYWNGTGLAGDKTRANLQLWALDGQLGVPAYVLVDEVRHVAPQRVVLLRPRGATNCCVRFAGTREVAGVTNTFVRAFAVPYVDEQMLDTSGDPEQIVAAASMAADITSAAVGMLGFAAIALQFDSDGGGGATRAGSIVIESRCAPGAKWIQEWFYDGTSTLVNSITVTATVELAAKASLELECYEIRARFIDSTGATGVGVLNSYAVRVK